MVDYDYRDVVGIAALAAIGAGLAYRYLYDSGLMSSASALALALALLAFSVLSLILAVFLGPGDPRDGDANINVWGVLFHVLMIASFFPCVGFFCWALVRSFLALF